MQIQPLGDRILVKRVKGKEVTEGGIFIPESAREKTGEGEVVAVGPGRPKPMVTYLDVGDLSPEEAVQAVVAARDAVRGEALTAPSVKKGDRVLFSAFAGTPLELEELENLPLAEGVDPEAPRETRRIRVSYVILREDDLLGVVQGEGNLEVEPVRPPAD